VCSSAAWLSVLLFRGAGYFPSEWGVELAAFAVLAIGALLMRNRLPLRRDDLQLVAGLIALALWMLISIAWASGGDEPVLAAERTLLYAGAAFALLLALDRSRSQWLLAGMYGAILAACVWGLATRLMASELGYATSARAEARLASPIGYANAMGALAASGIIITLAFARHDRRVVRAAAAAALVPLAVTLYFTLSRAALIALVAGVLVVVLVDRNRRDLRTLLPLAIAPLLAVLVTWRSPLAAGNYPIGCGSTGSRLALVVLGFALVNAALVLRAQPRRTAVGGLLGATLASAIVLSVSPTILLGHACHVPEKQRASLQGTTSAGRLASLSSSWRRDYWAVARDMIGHSPLLGEGAGSYARWWTQERTLTVGTRSSHSVYLDALAELGPVGLILLLLALSAPLLAVGPSLEPVPAAAVGVYLAWLVHMTLDWDWQLPALSLIALASAVIVLVDGRGEGHAGVENQATRTLAAAFAFIVLAAALFMQLGNGPAERSREALLARKPALAIAEAQRARTWMPWAAQPLQLLGEAEIEQGQYGLARSKLHAVVSRDPSRWRAWLELAFVSGGRQRAVALHRAQQLNPRGLIGVSEKNLELLGVNKILCLQKVSSCEERQD
jgi:O-antigen ligase